MPLDTSRVITLHAAQRCVDEWLNFLCRIDPKDERFAPSLINYREAIDLRNRLEQSLIAAD